MAFSDEDKEELKSMFGEFIKSANDNGSEEKDQSSQTKEKDEGLLGEAKKNMQNQNSQTEDQANIERAVGFNMNISTFAEKYKDILPEATKSVIDTANGKNYTSAIAKADEMRKAIIEAFLEVQTNVDSLTDGLRAKANTFKTLTEDAKRTKSAQFWEIVEIGAELQSSRKRAEALGKANGNTNGGEDDAFRQKFLSLGDKWKRKE